MSRTNGGKTIKLFSLLLFSRLRFRLSVSRKKKSKNKREEKSNKQLFSLLLGGKGNDKGCRDQSQFSRGGRGKKRGNFLKGKRLSSAVGIFIFLLSCQKLERTKNCPSPFVFLNLFFIVFKLVMELMQFF